MKIGISVESVTFIAETAYEGVHILYAALTTKLPYEGDRVCVPTEDFGTLRKFCDVLWEHEPALARQHFQNICKEMRNTRRRKIGYGNN